ncbi:sensor histidine kinase [Deinococcus misasensis]|uniref:sensor histidine kinase n=1 Tax=Deinococcus misasensis TaxID=392413 RepID=UPI0014701F7F|nr:PAS domain S-box protein [Deinococcus misasensis]
MKAEPAFSVKSIQNTLRRLWQGFGLLLLMAFVPTLFLLLLDVYRQQQLQQENWLLSTRTVSAVVASRVHELAENLNDQVQVQDRQQPLFGRCDVPFFMNGSIQHWGYQSPYASLRCGRNADTDPVPPLNVKVDLDHEAILVSDANAKTVRLVVAVPVRGGLLWAEMNPRKLVQDLPARTEALSIQVQGQNSKLDLLGKAGTLYASSAFDDALEFKASIDVQQVTAFQRGIVESYLKRTLGWVGVLLMVVLFSLRMRERYISQPLLKLLDATRQTADGQGTSEWPEEGLLADLSGAVKHMAERLKDRTREVTAQQKRYHDLINLAQDAVVVLDEQGTIVLANRVAHQMFGHPEGSLVDQSSAVLLPEGQRSMFQTSLLLHREDESFNRTTEAVGLRQDGTEFPMEMSVGSSVQPDGRVISVIIRDITQRKRTQQEQQMVFQLAQDLGSTSDPQTAMQMVLGQICEMYGWMLGEVWELRMDGKLHLATSHARYPEVFKGFIQQSQVLQFRLGEGLPGRALMDGQVQWISNVTEASFYRRREIALQHGLHAALAVPVVGEHLQLVLVWYHPRVLEQDEQLVQLTRTVVMQLRNVLNRIQSEAALRTANERYRQAVEQAPNPVLTVNSEGDIQHWNQTFAQMLLREDYSGMNVMDLSADPLPGKKVLEGIRTVYAGGAVQDLEVYFPEGGRHFLLDMYPLYDEQGQITQCVVTGTDITERLMMEQEREQRRVAEAASQAKSAFLSRMSHELRTPLNAVIGFSELLLYEPLDPEQKNDVREIHKAGKHLLSLVNDLLDLSAVEAGKVQVHKVRVPVRLLLDDLRMMFQELATRYQRSLHLPEVPEDLHVQGDPQRIRQVLINLVSNACKYGRTSVEVQVEVLEDRVFIHVKDDGEGLSAQQQKQLFVPFERLEQHEKVEGTGLGLVISHQYMTLMGGDLTVQSIQGEGSVFSMVFGISG